MNMLANILNAIAAASAIALGVTFAICLAKTPAKPRRRLIAKSATVTLQPPAPPVPDQPSGAAVIYFDPITGHRWGIAITGPHAGYVIEPCRCGAAGCGGRWVKIREACQDDVTLMNKLTTRVATGRTGVN